MDILSILNEQYPIRFDKIELLRDGGSASYAAISGGDKFFLRVIKPAFFDTAAAGADIQVFMQNKGFPVPPVIFTTADQPYIKSVDSLYILYSFIEGVESNPEQDAEAIGALVGNLHAVMKEYPGGLVKRNKRFYIDRYIDILRNRNYPKADEFSEYGEHLWDNIKNLPRGFCHGDIYSGNIHKTPGGALFLLDFDTACEGFPMYDVALICDMTEYFRFDERNYSGSNNVLRRFIPEYIKHKRLSGVEINAFHDLIAMQHFSTQATVMEIFGYDCLSDAELDYQLEWLQKWRAQCAKQVGV